MATGERPRHINAGGTDDQGYPAEVPRAWLTLTELVRFAASSQLPHRVELEAEVRRDGPGLRLIMPESAAQPDSFGSIHTARWWTWLQARAPFAGLTPATGLTAPLRVLQDRCPNSSAPATAFLPFGAAPPSMLGARSELTDARRGFSGLP